MSNGQWYPPEWPDRIRALAAGELTAATPRRAATVMLLRDPADAGGLPTVHMLRRRASMAFAGGAYAYPGGGVDPRDDDRLVGWAGPALESWAERLGVGTAAEAQAVVCAAVRETYEEAGVLLAGPTADTVVGDTTGAEWEADREALIARELSFAEFLDRRGLVLRSDLLGAWARWITPEFEPRRYDTWFFVAALPEGQRTRNASTEADRTVWIAPADAADGYDRGAADDAADRVDAAAAAAVHHRGRGPEGRVLAGPHPGARTGPARRRRVGTELAGPRRVHQTHSGRRRGR